MLLTAATARGLKVGNDATCLPNPDVLIKGSTFAKRQRLSGSLADCVSQFGPRMIDPPVLYKYCGPFDCIEGNGAYPAVKTLPFSAQQTPRTRSVWLRWELTGFSIFTCKTPLKSRGLAAGLHLHEISNDWRSTNQAERGWGFVVGEHDGSAICKMQVSHKQNNGDFRGRLLWNRL